ncbi:MAG TPA: VOC family protein [Candidatus Saccharimonadia bacterium]|nr:VOC family protein [Candidatus Saccharimonadia bacterium]
MSVVLDPYLHFDNNAEAAMDFYKSIFGGKAEITRFSEFPGMPVPEGQENLVMHSVLEADHIRLMMSDAAPIGGVTKGETVTLSLSGDDDATLTHYFEELSKDGTVTDELTEKPWGDKFGMVTDKFGIGWLVNITKPKA